MFWKKKQPLRIRGMDAFGRYNIPGWEESIYDVPVNVIDAIEKVREWQYTYTVGVLLLGDERAPAKAADGASDG